MSAAFGTMLNIKPMLTFDSEGKLKVLEKCKGMKKAFTRIIEHMERAPFDENKLAVVVHTDNEAGANELATLIENRLGVKPTVTIMGPVIGSHVGPGSVSCCWVSSVSREDLHNSL
jgi:DegV family protein with EDD domain